MYLFCGIERNALYDANIIQAALWLCSSAYFIYLSTLLLLYMCTYIRVYCTSDGDSIYAAFELC